MISKNLFYFLLAALIFMYACSETPTSSEDPDPDPNGEEELLLSFGEDEAPGKVKVISRNIYIGTDVANLLGAGSIVQIPTSVRDAFFGLVNTNFIERAEVLADEIEKTQPHLVGLQEVAHVFIQTPGDFLSGNAERADIEIYDYLQILLDELSARGLEYSVAAALSNADIELPMLPTSYSAPNSDLDDVRLVDRDVILIRNDIPFSDAVTVRYADSLVIDETLGISVPRGYAAVTAEIDGSHYRFANTHLEAFDITQTLRSGQLGQLLSAMEDETLPVILAGDFNFGPQDALYQLLMENDFEDAWVNNLLTYNPDGFTYGHDGDLQNSTVDFAVRIDYIFARSSHTFSFEESFVVGDELRDRTSSRLWPSDHGGVVTKIDFDE